MGLWRYITDPDTEQEFLQAFERSARVRRLTAVMADDVVAARRKGSSALLSCSHRHGPAYAYDLGTHWAYLVWLRTGGPEPLLVGVLSKQPGRMAIQAEIDQRLAKILSGYKP